MSYLQTLKKLEGKRLVEVSPLTQTELDLMGWSKGDEPVLLVFDDGTVVIPSRDPEGNGSGHLFVDG